MTRSVPPSPLELLGRPRLLLVRRVLGEQAVLDGAPTSVAADALLATCDLPYHVVQVAEGVSLPLRQALHLHVGHEQDVRAHARLAAALAAAHEVERVGLARDARAGGARSLHHNECTADLSNLSELVDPPRGDPSIARLEPGHAWGRGER